VVAARGGGSSSRRRRRPKLKQADRGGQKRHRLKAVAALARGGGDLRWWQWPKAMTHGGGADLSLRSRGDGEDGPEMSHQGGSRVATDKIGRGGIVRCTCRQDSMGGPAGWGGVGGRSAVGWRTLLSEGERVWARGPGIDVRG
jgi:hypothetical protein